MTLKVFYLSMKLMEKLKLEYKRKPKMSNITQKWVSVLMPFLEDYSARKSASEISRQAKLPQQTVSRILNKLTESNLIGYSREGKNKLFYFRDKKMIKTIINILENQKTLEFQLKNKRVSVIINEFLDNSDGVILFGSYASGGYDSKSDLDLVIFNGKDVDKIKRRYSIKINIHSVGCSEFKKMLDKKNPLALEILKNHVLFGNVSEVVNIFWGFYNG